MYSQLEGGGRRAVPTLSMRTPSPVLPKGEKDATFHNFDSAEIARQLTLMEYESYCCIRPRECLNQVRICNND